MGPLAIDTLKNALVQAKGFVVAKTSEWGGRIVAYLKNGAACLEDPRYASGAVFAINFIIFEVALRLSMLVELILPNDTKTEENIQYVSRIIVGSCLVIAGNMLFAEWFGIALHPLVITAIAIASLIVRHELHGHIAKV